jgi:hypothetical protein
VSANLGRLRRRPLRRYRELVCFGVAGVLWLIAWYGQRQEFSGGRGRGVLAALAGLETLTLLTLFVLEGLRRRGPGGRRWITLAWMSIPIWICLDVVAATVLRATA